MTLYEHTPESFQELIDAIMALGFDEKTASDYAMLIGDTPVIDEQGRVVVSENGRELARLKLSYFDDTEDPEPEEFIIEGDPVPPDYAAIVRLMRQIEAMGYDEKTAARYARLISKNPVRDEHGLFLVKDDDGRLITRLKLKTGC
jgi:hypothetical protein